MCKQGLRPCKLGRTPASLSVPKPGCPGRCDYMPITADFKAPLTAGKHSRRSFCSNRLSATTVRQPSPLRLTRTKSEGGRGSARSAKPDPLRPRPPPVKWGRHGYDAQKPVSSFLKATRARESSEALSQPYKGQVPQAGGNSISHR